ncbi:CLUMA_CG001347, isoform A [Clunio marinus]|uniref:CLUMA_CG001347, isoform A n=1 Tax=Clunio marinus TaxID=568069 RepID=A0A1J1HM72_9DIPT|nr:CLUMA_CG001347, isoform A [Clunio marinus]
MYCCVECKDEHDKLLHLFECGQEPLHESVALTVKMILTALTLTGSIQNLQRILNDSKCQTVFDLDLSKPQDESHKLNILLAINALTTVRETEHTKSVSLEEMFEKHPFDLFLKTDVEREFMRSFTNKQLKILDTNLYDMKEHSYLKSSNRTHGHSIGSGLCVFASLFSHSCDPSVKRITVDNKIAFVVVQPIQANEQIFVSYGYSSYEMPREIRQLHLESYGFLCDCVACQKHYPLLSKQPRRISYYNEPNHNAMTALAAICELKKACKFIENIYDRHPCYETTDMMIYCDHLLHQISKLPLEEYALSKAKKH